MIASTFASAPIRRVLVVGAGVMGIGIARSFAEHGFDTALLSRRAGSLGPIKGVRLVGELPPEAPELVIESVPEEMEPKRELFHRLEAAYPATTLIASNTSSLDLVRLFAGMKHPARFLGAHYFQPADVIPLVEVVSSGSTDPGALERTADAMRRAGKDPIVLRRPINGFLVNRLQHAILHESYYLISKGIVTVEDVDNVAKTMLGPRMCITGLIQQKDISGLAVHALAQREIVPTLAPPGPANADVQAMIAAGNLGLSTGKGFYDWSGCDAKAVREQSSGRLNALLAFLKQTMAGDRPGTRPKGRDIRAKKS